MQTEHGAFVQSFASSFRFKNKNSNRNIPLNQTHVHRHFVQGHARFFLETRHMRYLGPYPFQPVFCFILSRPFHPISFHRCAHFENPTCSMANARDIVHVYIYIHVHIYTYMYLYIYISYLTMFAKFASLFFNLFKSQLP